MASCIVVQHFFCCIYYFVAFQQSVGYFGTSTAWYLYRGGVGFGTCLRFYWNMGNSKANVFPQRNATSMEFEKNANRFLYHPFGDGTSDGVLGRRYMVHVYSGKC